MLDYERRAWAAGRVCVAGVDEAGRGPWAGPVVAAAVSVSCAALEQLFAGPWRTLNDSKKITDRARRNFFFSIQSMPEALAGLGICSAADIDEHNILRATHLAMSRAVHQLPRTPDHLLVDGLPVKGLPVDHEAIVGGDGKSLLIAAASIMAKVTRDNIMIELDRRYPGYGFSRHKGYGTREHLAALQRLGPCPEHRRSFAPVSQLVLPITPAPKYIPNNPH